MRHRVIERAPGRRGFVVVEKRWAVERSFGALAHWSGRWDGLLRSRAGRSDVAAARFACVVTLSGVAALANSKPMLGKPA